MDYKIVSVFGGSHEHASKQLEETINSLIKQGWLPQGGVSISDNSGMHMSQAMIKK